MASIKSPVKFIEVADSEHVVFAIGDVQVISNKHEVADRIVTLRHEGWTDEYLAEEFKAIEELKKFNTWPQTIEG